MGKNQKTGKFEGYINNIDTAKLLAVYDEQKTIKATAKYFNVSTEGLRLFFIRNKIPYNKKIIYAYNELFFNTDNENSFYWAGLIAADGNISEKGDFTLSLKSEDENHIIKLKKEINSNAPIKYSPPAIKIIDGVKTKTSGNYIIRFRAKHWINDLKKFNIVPAKTSKYSIPQWAIDHPNFKHFIRGYFDGDGWFSFNENKKRLVWGLCGNLDVLKQIQIFLINQSKLKGKPKIYKQKNIFKFNFSNQNDVLGIVNLLWGDATIYLDRKYQISLWAEQCDAQTIVLNLDENKLREAYQRLKSIKLIAQEFNCCKNSIHNYIKKYNIIK